MTTADLYNACCVPGIKNRCGQTPCVKAESMTQTDQASEPMAQASGAGRTVDRSRVSVYCRRGFCGDCWGQCWCVCHNEDACHPRCTALGHGYSALDEVEALRTQLAEARGIAVEAVSKNRAHVAELVALMAEDVQQKYLKPFDDKLAALATLKEQAR